MQKAAPSAAELFNIAPSLPTLFVPGEAAGSRVVTTRRERSPPPRRPPRPCEQGQLREQGLLDAHGGHVEGDTGPARSAPRQEEGSEVADSLERLLPRRQRGEEVLEEVRGKRGRITVAALLDAPCLFPALAVAERVAQGVEAEAGREGVITQRRRQPVAELIQVLPHVLRQDRVIHTLGEARRDGLAKEATGCADVPAGPVALVLPVAGPEQPQD